MSERVVPTQGDIIKFGRLSWRVLKVEEGKVLLLSETVLERYKFHGKQQDISWAQSDIRAYLNETLLSDCGVFSSEDRLRIADTEVVTLKNPWFDTPGGDSTTDKVFLLSIEEVADCLGADSEQLEVGNPSSAREFALRFDDDFDADQLLEDTGGRGLWISDDYNKARTAYDAAGAAVHWWLRSPGIDPGDAASVNADGSLSLMGFSVSYDGDSCGGVRPALWLKL